MDCDRVFMELTRGPFPAGAPTDAAVEAHLERCVDCWRFAEALRPAHPDQLEEGVPAGEAADLPGYWGLEDQQTRQAHHQVRTLVLGSLATQRAPATRAPLPIELPDLQRRLGWPDVARMGLYGAMLVASALAVAWLYQSQ